METSETVSVRCCEYTDMQQLDFGVAPILDSSHLCRVTLTNTKYGIGKRQISLVA